MRYGKYAAKAMDRIARYGSPLTVRRSGGMSYDAGTDTYTGGGEEIHGHAVQMRLDQRDADGTNVRIGDVLLMAALDGEPRSNDTAVYGGRSYTVVSVESVRPDGVTDIYYRIQAR